ncbi:MAG: hypothetical protein PHD43_19310 [Methylococcales bacterium]|nr:hypothetical protein [Methylococcales bacterium]
MKILVAGSFESDDLRADELTAFCQALGVAIISQGHTLLSGCMNNLDMLVAKAAYEQLLQLQPSKIEPDISNPKTHFNSDSFDPKKRMISYVMSGKKPVHNFGMVVKSRLADWELSNESLYIPEQIQMADALIPISGGSEGTYIAANWARISRKPLLPVAIFGGATEKIYNQELSVFNEKYAGKISELDYQILNTLDTNLPKIAAEIVSLAEKLVLSKQVIAIMSYSEQRQLEDAYESFQLVCEEGGYQCQRVDHSNTVGRIVQEIIEKIEYAAFVIADLTELKTNVFYELGYADGLRKPVIITAKEGTELPFDLADKSTVFWNSQRELKDGLRTKIGLIAKEQLS